MGNANGEYERKPQSMQRGISKMQALGRSKGEEFRQAYHFMGGVAWWVR